MPWIAQLHLGIKIKVCVLSLKEVAKNEHKNPRHQKIKLKEDLVDLHAWMEMEEVTPTFLNHENELNAKILKAARHEEEELRIKSRELWLKSGDNNMAYFHNQTKARQRYNFIREIKYV